MLSPKEKLAIINQERDPQKKLAAFVLNGFTREASEMIRTLARNHTAMLYCEWKDDQLCSPLPRVTTGSPAVYVVITSGNKFDGRRNHQKKDDWCVIFEIDWEREALDWSSRDSRDFVSEIIAQALVRPLNQWSLQQAEGTARVARAILSADDSMSREVAGLHLLYHLREADFEHIVNYLYDIPEFFPNGGNQLTIKMIVNWIIKKLLELGWTESHIRKELVEWMHLKTGTWPQWLLAIAQATVFKDGDLVRKVAVRRWIHENLMNWTIRRDTIKPLQELLKIGGFGVNDREWALNKARDLLLSGREADIETVGFFVAHFHDVFDTGPLCDVLEAAAKVAADSGDYGVAIKLHREVGLTAPPDEWFEKARILGVTIYP